MLGKAAALGLLAGALAAGLPALAQSGSSPAIEVTVGGGGSRGGTWDGSWSPGPAGVLGVGVPYGPGLFRLGLRGYANEGVADLPGFVAIHADAAWGPVFRLPAGVRAVPDVHVGMVAFLFDDDDVDEPLRNESELAVGVRGRLNAPLWRMVGAWVGVDAVRIFTRPGEDVLFMEGGLSVGVPAPAWLSRAAR